jgi:DNA repair protein SbcC/Rad50
MIPVQLTLHNFMCYRDNVPPISFESIHTACISGNNGNGKSALIDAITWALWGQTRATGDDDLIHAGQNEVAVQFDFGLGKDQYRIIRKHSRPKTAKSSGQTLLEFQLASPEGYKVLSGDTVTQTQQQITQLLRMDYDTFINSAFLRQGRADEFTKKRPGDRKQVLGNILQLSTYDELEEKAKEKAKDQNSLIDLLEASISTMQEELARKPGCQSEYDQAQVESSQAEVLVSEQEKTLAELRKAKESLENKKIEMAELDAHIKDTERNYSLWLGQVKQYQYRIGNYENLIAQKSTIEKNYDLLSQTRKQCHEYDQKFKQVNILSQAKHRLELSIVKAGEELNRVHAVSENKIRELEQTADRLPQFQDLTKQVTIRLRSLDDTDIKIHEKRETSKLLRARVHFLQAEKTRLIQEIDQIEEKLKIISHPDGVTCPLCETELGVDGRRRIESKYHAQKLTTSEALKSNHVELTQKENEVRILENEIIQSEAKMKHDKEIAQSQYGNYDKAISDAKEANEKAVVERKLLEDIEAKLASRDFAINEQQSLMQIEKEIDDCGYNAQEHDRLLSQLTDLDQYEIPMHKLEEAEELISQEKEAASKAQRIVDELHQKKELDLRRKQSLFEEVNVFSKIAEDLIQAENKYRDLLNKQKKAQEIMGGAKARLERLAELEIQYQEKARQRGEAVKQERIYKDLAQAFGKKGIQAMLIEMAIPEIESEANKLLARMTDNRMSVKIETQRETKKGDVMETLDINISDELGTRNYEMFSGGEAFRIDFAIRIALSKLLARRAGAPLPTLIIDEGFGTQDSTGIEKIKEAITSIQDDFEKILVITHIADFKDAFPMRIEVVKTPEGSTISLN